MCEEPAAAEEEPAAEEAAFDLASLSDENAALLETIKGLTLEECAALIKEAEKTFNTGPKEDTEEEEEPVAA